MTFSSKWSRLILRCYRVKGQHGEEIIVVDLIIMNAFQKSIYWNTSKMTAGPQLYIHDNINIKKMCQTAFMTGIYLWVWFLFFVHFSLCSLTRSARELTDVTDFVFVNLSYVLSLSSFLNCLLLLISLFLSVMKLYKNGRMNETSEESGNLWCKNLY